ncbi:hypothetical protein YC2023_087590 [Brassica napus]
MLLLLSTLLEWDVCFDPLKKEDLKHEQSNPTLTTWHNYITHNILTTLFLKLLTSINSHSICILNKRRRRRKRKTTISAVLEPFLPEKYVSLPGTESEAAAQQASSIRMKISLRHSSS